MIERLRLELWRLRLCLHRIFGRRSLHGRLIRFAEINRAADHLQSKPFARFGGRTDS